MAIIWGRYSAPVYCALLALICAALATHWPWLWVLSAVLWLLAAQGLRDYLQSQHAVIANYPLLGHLRFFFESVRPELRQYFWESDSDALPYSRNQRAMVYQRAKQQVAVRPFGSTENMYAEEFDWLNHSMAPVTVGQSDFRVTVGVGPHTYAMSALNISGTSFGALSPPAIQALNTGARLGAFAHNTGEGGISPYHLAGGGDLIWQIASGYFGCRTVEGRFDPDEFARKATLPQVKMIEIKLSQGAKPGQGGMLLAPKVTAEIAAIRGVEQGRDCISPAHHSEFATPDGLLAFAARLRELSGGKPVGIKLCIGQPWEFLAIVRAMVDSGQLLDFITVDGAEGGTGAAPAEFTDHVGTPLQDALVFVDNCLRGAGLRQRVKVAASGKVVSAYDLVRQFALGADWVNMARPFMFAVGCIQARDCSSGNCPTGVATMDPARYRVLDVAAKAARVVNFHHNTTHAVAELLGAAGLTHPGQLDRHHVVRRLADGQTRTLAQIYPPVAEGALLDGQPVLDPLLRNYWPRVSGARFGLV